MHLVAESTYSARKGNCVTYAYPGQKKRRLCSGRLVGFVEPCLLLLLSNRQDHGYDLVERLESCGFWGSESEPSLVYRVLRSMESAGLVTSTWDTTASGTPPRRVYSITAEGRQTLMRWAIYLQETDQLLHRFLVAYEKLSRSQNPKGGEAG